MADLVTLGGLISRLQGLINRPRSFTRELAIQFINQAIANLERTLRIGNMERVVFGTMDGNTNYVRIPNDFLSLNRLFTTEGGQLNQVELGEYLRRTQSYSGEGIPEIFTKVADRWMLHPKPANGIVLHVFYYGQSRPLQVDTDRNTWTQSATSAVLYAAAQEAAIYFQDDARADRYAALAQKYRDEIELQDLDEEFSGPMEMNYAPGLY
jgi:hypothetical protein